MKNDELQAALDAATATLAAGGIPRASLHARDALALALVACVSALRDVLAQTERERDEARARIARYVAALDERHAAECDALHDDPAAKRKAAARIARACDEYDYARVALRETPAGEGER